MFWRAFSIPLYSEGNCTNVKRHSWLLTFINCLSGFFLYRYIMRAIIQTLKRHLRVLTFVNCFPENSNISNDEV